MTGSHNLGFKASTKNDDNLMIIEGNRRLAAAYAANIIAIYQSYRWNAYVEAHRQDPKVWHGLVNRDNWQNDYLVGDELAELTFWMGAYQPAKAAAATAAATPQLEHVPQLTPPAGESVPKSTKHAPKKPHAGKIAAARKKKPMKTAAARKKKAVKKRPTKVKKPTEKKSAVKKSAGKKSKTKKKKR